MFHEIVALVSALLWPGTVLVLVYIFRREIRNLIATVVEAKIGDRVLLRWQIRDEAVASTEKLLVAQTTEAPPAAHWENSANLFWLGADLHWASDAVLLGAPKERIIHGLKQANHHSSELGLSDTDPGKQLALLLSRVTHMSEQEMTRPWRNGFVTEIYSVISGFDAVVKKHQPKFRPGPES